MDEDVNKRRYAKLGFKPQKENVYNKLLPYADKLDEESTQLYANIKTNLVKSVLAREMRPGCALWTSRLNKYAEWDAFPKLHLLHRRVPFLHPISSFFRGLRALGEMSNAGFGRLAEMSKSRDGPEAAHPRLKRAKTIFFAISLHPNSYALFVLLSLLFFTAYR